MTENKKQVRFVYEKARHHRTFRADGAWASTTPKGEVQVAFFNDIRPMPQEVTHAVGAGGVLGDEVAKIHDLEDIIREAHVTVVMDRESTHALINLLQMILTNLERQDVDKKIVEGQAPSEPNKTQ